MTKPATLNPRRTGHWLAAVALGAAAALGATAARAEPLLHVEAGLLTGASGVLVNGTAYDVSFSDGSCNSLQLNCTQFTFNNSADAAAASQALLDQVFTGVYDTSPMLTRGCGLAGGCLVSTIYGPDPAGPTDYNVATATNSAVEAGDSVAAQGIIGAIFDTTFIPAATIAVWSAAAPPARVAEPAALPLTLAGLGLLWATRRRKHKQPR
ncbi:MAG: hypothetical protein JNL85_17530 [Rubrivivax sp.]|nr:hypothetical protein [Rubrivivax sp.]